MTRVAICATLIAFQVFDKLNTNNEHSVIIPTSCIHVRVFYTECDNKTYGPGCNETCNDNCKSCHHINGSCNSDSDPGYKDVECTVGEFI